MTAKKNKGAGTGTIPQTHQEARINFTGGLVTQTHHEDLSRHVSGGTEDERRNSRPTLIGVNEVYC